MRYGWMGAAVAAGVMLCGWVGVERAEAATVVYTGFADITDPLNIVGGPATNVPFVATFNEDNVTCLKFGTCRQESIGFYDHSDNITGSIDVGIAGGSASLSNNIFGFYLTSQTGRTDNATDEDPLNVQASYVGEIGYGVRGAGFYGVSLFVSYDGVASPTNPETPFFANLKPGQAFGYYDPAIGISYDGATFENAGVGVTLRPLTISVNGDLTPVPLPSPLASFAASLAVLGGLAYARRRAQPLMQPA